MLLSNLAQPEWITASCHNNLLETVVCIKYQKDINVTQTNVENSINYSTCQNDNIRIQQKCFLFIWGNKYSSEYCKVYNQKE